jgi:hypothetical protein
LVNDSAFNFGPRVAVDRRDGDFVVAFQREDSLDINTFVGEFSKKGTLRHSHSVSTDNSTRSSISIDRFGTYLVIFEHLFATGNHDIFGALGTLA